jgi:hypothetical protein
VVAGVVVVGELTAPEDPVVPVSEVPEVDEVEVEEAAEEPVSEVPDEPVPVVAFDTEPASPVAEWATGSEAIRTPSPEAASTAVRPMTAVSRRTRVTARSREWAADGRIGWKPCESCAMRCPFMTG